MFYNEFNIETLLLCRPFLRSFVIFLGSVMSDVIMILPKTLFVMTIIPICSWFLFDYHDIHLLGSDLISIHHEPNLMVLLVKSKSLLIEELFDLGIETVTFILIYFHALNPDSNVLTQGHKRGTRESMLQSFCYGFIPMLILISIMIAFSRSLIINSKYLS